MWHAHLYTFIDWLTERSEEWKPTGDRSASHPRRPRRHVPALPRRLDDRVVGDRHGGWRAPHAVRVVPGRDRLRADDDLRDVLGRPASVDARAAAHAQATTRTECRLNATEHPFLFGISEPDNFRTTTTSNASWTPRTPSSTSDRSSFRSTSRGPAPRSLPSPRRMDSR